MRLNGSSSGDCRAPDIDAHFFCCFEDGLPLCDINDLAVDPEPYGFCFLCLCSLFFDCLELADLVAGAALYAGSSIDMMGLFHFS